MRMLILLLVLACVCASLAQQGKILPPLPGPKLPLPPIEKEIERPVTSNSYIAVAPNRIRPAHTMTIPVYFLKPITTGQSVTGVLMDRNNKTLSTDTVIVDTNNPAKEVQIKLVVPKNIDWGTYYVELTGEGDIPFYNRTSMYSNRRALVILVQTDRAVYKPGEKVQYRILTINGDLTPISTPLNIDFHDPGRHKMGERNGEQNLNGLQGEFQLADRTSLGNWQITVKATDYDETKRYSFEVKEYVLPKFEVTVELPKYALSEDNSDLTGSVKAFYTFGKPVIGRAIVTLSQMYGTSWFNVRGVQIEKEINGEVDFAFKRVAIERLSRYLSSGTSLRVNVNVTETITGITLGGEGSVRYYSNPYKIEFFPNMPDNFKPGFNPYKGMVKVTLQDGSPPPVNPTQKLHITVTHFTESKVTSVVPNTISVQNYKLISPFLNGDVILINTKDYVLQPDGTVMFDIVIPDEVATFSIKAEFEKQKVFKDVRRFRARGDTKLKAELLSTNLKINDNANIKFTSTTPGRVNFMVQAKGKIAEFGEVIVNTKIGQGKYTGTGSFVVTKAMAPSAKFVGFLYHPVDGEIYGDGLNFVVEDIFENKVSLSFNNATQTVLPASDIALQVNAAPESFIGILAVDKSSKLLKEGNDITQQRVKDELRSFGNTPWFPRGWGIRFPWPISADDTNDIFNNANLKLLTDAYVEKFDLWRQPQRRFKSAAISRSGGFSSRSMAMMDSEVALGGGGSAPSGQIRKDFPETWIWEAIQSSSGSESITAKVPDTITEFQANAFAIHPTAGLGVAEMTANLTVFKPFFVNLQIPYSIIRGETAVIQANVFNYRDTDEYVTVRLEGSTDFDSITIDASGNEVPQSGSKSQCILVPSKQPTAVFFSIKPKVIKDVMLKVRASIPNVPYDEVQRPLPVKAEGIEKSKNIPLLFSVKSDAVGLTETKTIKYPAELVDNSEHIAVSVIGDLFGPSLRNLDKLINIPSGCGEQNLIKFAPVVFAVKYMKDTQRNLDPELQKKSEQALKLGYQRQLLYQRNDKSFSGFGNADDSGSSWLTAFVVKSFAQASTLNLAYFDVNVIDGAVKYIIDRSQAPDGSFTSVGVVNNKALQGGSIANSRALTAYKVIALLEVQKAEILKNPDTIAKLNSAIVNAMNFLRNTPPNHTPTDYERAITAYALQLGGRDEALVVSLLAELEGSPNRKIVSDNRKYWDLDSRSLEIELASYVLMTYAARRDPQSGYMILNWLVDQRNPYGGFVSTQDTVIALQALSEFAVLVYVKDVNAVVTIYTTSTSGVISPVQTVSLTSDNHDILHLRYFDGTDVASVTVRVTGSGLAMVDIGQTYNVKSEAPSNSYDMNVISKDETEHKYTLNICASYIKSGDATSNMAIINAGAISGFAPEMDGIQVDTVASSPSNIRIKRKESSNKRAILYFDEIPKTPGQVCVNIPFQQETLVAGVQPANVLVYSYYEPDEKESKHYLPTILATSNLCKTCGANCGCPSTTPPKTLPLSMCGAGRTIKLPVAPQGYAPPAKIPPINI